MGRKRQRGEMGLQETRGQRKRSHGKEERRLTVGRELLSGEV